MEPGRFFKQVGKHSTINKIDFKVYPQFSDEFWRKREARNNALSEDLLQYFSVENNWTIEGVNYFMILYKKEKIIPTTDLMELFQKGKAIVKMFSEPT